MQLSKIQKTFSQHFAPFLKYASYFNLFQKMTTLIADVFPKLHTPKDLVKPMSKQRRYQTPFNSHYVKSFQTLAKSA